MSATTTRCFVIMPFSQTTEEHTEDYWTRHFEGFLKPLIEECPGLEAHRSEPLRGDMLRQIITDLVTVPVVVADITDRNPNVYWELGVRQSFKHGTVTIAEEGTERPFDISVKGMLYYSDNRLRNAEFRRQFKRAIRDCISNPDTPDSHVLETISGRGSLYEIIRREEVIRRLKALFSEYERNKDVLDEIYKEVDKDTGPSIIVTNRLHFSSIELLVTTRYLDEPDSFYMTNEKYCDDIIAINEQLSVWEQFTKSTRKWFKDEKKANLKTFKNFKQNLDKIGKKWQISSDIDKKKSAT